MAAVYRLLYSVKDMFWIAPNTPSEFDNLLKSKWKSVEIEGHLNYKLDVTQKMKTVYSGPMSVLLLTLSGRFNKRRECTLFKYMDESCPLDGFNFTKVKSIEKLFEVMLQGSDPCFGLVIANLSPFMFGHSLLVPNPEQLLNQRLRKPSLQLALQVMLLSTDEYLCLGFNSLLACASVNHLHFHLWYSTHRLFASACPTRKKSLLRMYDELDSHPVDNFAFEFYNPDEFQALFERLWVVVKQCQDMEIAHNLFASRNTEGALRVVLWLRRSVYDAKAYQQRLVSPHACAFDIAVAELAGMIVVPDEEIANSISLPGALQEFYLNELLSYQKMSQLTSSLSSMES